MRFRFFSGDINWKVYGGKFISPRFNNGDWDYWLVMEIENVSEYDDFDYKYIVSISAVSPTAAKNKLENALESCGATELYETTKNKEELAIECLLSYGINAVLYTEQGNNLYKLMKTARKKAEGINFSFGLVMDKQLNTIGNNGWDFISGNIGF